MDKATFDNVASILESNLHIPKSWFYNLNTFGVAELLTSTIGTLAIALNWNSEDREAFSKIIGSTAIVSTLSANPILLIVTLAALAKSFSDARREGNYTEFVEGLAKGGVVTGAVIATSSVVAGPVFVGLLAGLCAGILANKAMDNVSIVQIRDYLVVSFNTAIKNAKYSQNQSS